MGENGEKKGVDFYQVLGLDKECTPIDLKTAYKKLAKRWHPDRCSATGNSNFVEEAKKKFQAIQEAYSVLSDETTRFLYDVGVYDNEDDENNHGMGDFLNEMVTMMSEHKPSENGEESFEQLQELFEDMFQRDGCDSYASTSSLGMNPSCSSSYGSSIEEGLSINNKRNSLGMNRTEAPSTFDNVNFEGLSINKRNSLGINRTEALSSFDNVNFESFCLGMECREDSRKIKGTTVRTQGSVGSNCSINGGNSGGRRYGREQKVAPGHDVSSTDYSGIST